MLLRRGEGKWRCPPVTKSVHRAY